jgi:hypothetical protein
VQVHDKPEADALEQQREVDAEADTEVDTEVNVEAGGAEEAPGADPVTELEADPADVRDQRLLADDPGAEDDYPPT